MPVKPSAYAIWVVNGDKGHFEFSRSVVFLNTPTTPFLQPHLLSWNATNELLWIYAIIYMMKFYTFHDYPKVLIFTASVK